MRGPVRTILGLACAIALTGSAAAATRAEVARWRDEAARVTITRDDWGVAHVHGARDADAVFGAIYAQAEDDFGRIESNYLDALGRRAEAEAKPRSGPICARACSWIPPISVRGGRPPQAGSAR